MRILPILFACLLSLNTHAIQFFPFDSGSGGSATSPTWQEYTINYTDFTAAAMVENIELANLPADTVIHGVQIKPTTSFGGGGISGYDLSVGLAGDFERFASDFDVTTAVTATNHQDSLVYDTPDTVSSVSVRIRATSTGVNLNNATGGVARVRLLISNP